ncbi:MAG: glycosyltransferase family 2 protein [Candidatus Hodarchaeota archaeon]
MSIEVSIILPILNEEPYIEKCLKSIISQDFPKDKLEVLLVDGKSTDNTRQIIEYYQKRYSFIKLITNPNKIVPTAMNMGINRAKGNFIVRMDAHCEYDPNYVSNCIQSLRKTSAENVGGPMKARGINYLGQAIAAVHHCFFGLGGAKFHDEKYEGYVDTVYLGAFRKELFNKIGLYNEKLVRNQDIELNSRIIRNGGKIYLTPDIKSYYYNRSSLRKLWRQNFENGRWNIYTTSISANTLSLRHFIPFLFVVSLIISSIFSIFSVMGKLILMFIVATYLSLSLAFSLKISLNNNIQLIPSLPLVFLILHVSYGMGSLWGVLTVRKFKS